MVTHTTSDFTAPSRTPTESAIADQDRIERALGVKVYVEVDGDNDGVTGYFARIDGAGYEEMDSGWGRTVDAAVADLLKIVTRELRTQIAILEGGAS